MTTHGQYEELAKQLGAIGVIKRGLSRVLPPDCPPTSAIVLALLKQYGELRMSKLAELMVIDTSVTSRHVAHATERGWIDRQPDPLDKRSRLLRINPRGEALLDEVSTRYAQALAGVLHDWSDNDVARLIGLLARLREGFGECRPLPLRPQGAADPATRTPA